MQQANTTDELPERLIGAVRVSHMELSSAIIPELESETPWQSEILVQRFFLYLKRHVRYSSVYRIFNILLFFGQL